MAAGYCYSLGIKTNNFFLKDNKKAFILWLNVPKVTDYNHRGMKKKLMDLMPVEPFHGEPLAVVREPNELESSLM